jgi:heme exporter protein D
MEATMPMTADSKPPHFSREAPSWTAVAAMLLSVMMPVCGWMISLSNRVAVLEEKTQSLATSAQMAEVKTQIADWIAESERERINDRVVATRESK